MAFNPESNDALGELPAVSIHEVQPRMVGIKKVVAVGVVHCPKGPGSALSNNEARSSRVDGDAVIGFAQAQLANRWRSLSDGDRKPASVWRDVGVERE
jgi:hypothetical protein